MTDKWDCQGRSIDLTGKKKLVIIDFDNTRISLRLCAQKQLTPLVFRTPLPNGSLWSKDTYAEIMSHSFFVNGGW